MSTWTTADAISFWLTIAASTAWIVFVFNVINRKGGRK